MMTDNEIIKALECCVKNNCTYDCPFYHDSCIKCKYSSSEIIKFAFDLINRQKAEIERLQSMNQAKLDTIHDLMTEIEKLQNESIGNCEMAIAMRSDHNLEGDCNYCIDKAKSEARKELIEKIKSKFTHKGKSTKYGEFTWDDVTSYELDNLLKEMESENNV